MRLAHSWEEAFVDLDFRRRKRNSAERRPRSDVGVGSWNLRRSILFTGEGFAIVRNRYNVIEVSRRPIPCASCHVPCGSAGNVVEERVGKCVAVVSQLDPGSVTDVASENRRRSVLVEFQAVARPAGENVVDDASAVTDRDQPQPDDRLAVCPLLRRRGRGHDKRKAHCQGRGSRRTEPFSM